MDQQEIIKDLRRDLKAAKTKLLKSLTVNDTALYFDTRTEIEQIKTMLKIAGDYGF